VDGGVSTFGSGPVAVTPARLTIPAGGSATATVTLDPAAATAGKLYSGAVTVGVGGSAVLRLPVGFEVELERYDVSVTVLDRHGAPYAGGRVDVINGDNVNGASYFNVTLNAKGQGTPGSRRAGTACSRGSRRRRRTAPSSRGLRRQPEVRVSADTPCRSTRGTPSRCRRRPFRTSRPASISRRLREPLRRRAGGYIDTDFPTPQDIAAGRVLVQPNRPVTHGKYALTTRWRLLPTVERGAPISTTSSWRRPTCRIRPRTT